MATHKDDTVLPKNFRSYCRVCTDFERQGLNCFNEDGNYGGYDGEIIIAGILIFFEQLEMYKDCAFLRDFLIEYRNKFRPTDQSV
jgi:hypothetical protein